MCVDTYDPQRDARLTCFSLTAVLSMLSTSTACSFSSRYLFTPTITCTQPPTRSGHV
jgi:hypothetical protein